jgi:hypothetical protein
MHTAAGAHTLLLSLPSALVAVTAAASCSCELFPHTVPASRSCNLFLQAVLQAVGLTTATKVPPLHHWAPAVAAIAAVPLAVLQAAAHLASLLPLTGLSVHPRLLLFLQMLLFLQAVTAIAARLATGLATARNKPVSAPQAPAFAADAAFPASSSFL